MPAVTAPAAEKTEKEEQLWIALKSHIIRERQRKKQEQEAEVEEERQRKEREARERQDVMTLGETREQIQILNKKLQELKNEKQQLFLQLKKVLNEDENRKKQQQQKETNELLAMHGTSTPFFPPRPHHPSLLTKGLKEIATYNTQLKRNRSPSPTPQGYYKTQQPYPQSPKHEEGRRGGDGARAVLWNKPSQYSNPPGTLFYPTPQNPPDSRATSIIYPTYPPNLNIPLRQNYHVEMAQSQQQQQLGKKDMSGKVGQPGTLFQMNIEAPPQSAQMVSDGQKHNKTHNMSAASFDKMSERGSYQHLEMKHEDRKDVRSSQQQSMAGHITDGLVYTNALRPGQIPIHSAVMSMSPSQQQMMMQGAKPGGSITQGYPNRAPNGSTQPPPQILYPRYPY